MKRKVLITKAPLQKAQQGLFTKEKLTNNAFQFPVTFKEGMAPGFEVKKNLGPVDRDKANIEAERGETILTPMGDDAWTKTLPKTYIIGGKKHYAGGTPLSVPEGSFIFSDHLKEKNQKIHEMLGKAAKKSGYTYAELSKPFMLNDDIRVLLDPDSDKITRDTAELNIKNKVNKLGLISLLQESSKGFSSDDGSVDIPTVGIPYIEKTGLDIESAIDPFLDAIKQPAQQPQGQMPMQEEMPEMAMGKKGGLVKMKAGGSVPKYQNAGTVSKLKEGERVRYNSANGKYEVINTQGVVVGYVNFPNNKSTKITKSKIPSNAVVLSRKEYEADKEAAFAATQGKPLVIKNEDGTYKQIIKKSVYDDYKGEDLNTIFAGDADVARQYQYITQKFNNDKVKAELSRRAVAAIGDSTKNSKSLTSAEKEKLKQKLQDPEYAYQLFMDMQKRNLAMYAHQRAGTIKPISAHQDAADSGAVTNKDFVESWAKIGVTAPSDEEAKLEQALYHGYKSLIDDKAKLDPELQGAISTFGIMQVGARDKADVAGTGAGKISRIDGKYTNTTSGQIAGVTSPYTLGESDLGLEDELMTPADAAKQRQYAKGDIRKGWTGPNKYGLYRATKELYGDRANEPFVAAPATYLPRAYLLSPEDMQRNYRGMAMGAGEQMLASAATPQAMAALSSLSGADAMAQYTAQIHNANQQTLTNTEHDRANRLTQAFQNFANVATTLHDRWTQLKENLQARKSAARAAVEQEYAAGEQTEMNIQGVNLRTPNYQLDPGTMDYTGFIPTLDDIDPTYNNQKQAADLFAEYSNRFPNADSNTVSSLVKMDLGLKDQYPDYTNYSSGIPI